MPSPHFICCLKNLLSCSITDKQQLAKDLDVDRNSLDAWLDGRSAPAEARLQGYASRVPQYGTPEWLIDGTGRPPLWIFNAIAHLNDTEVLFAGQGNWETDRGTTSIRARIFAGWEMRAREVFLGQLQPSLNRDLSLALANLGETLVYPVVAIYGDHLTVEGEDGQDSPRVSWLRGLFGNVQKKAQIQAFLETSKWHCINPKIQKIVIEEILSLRSGEAEKTYAREGNPGAYHHQWMERDRALRALVGDIRGQLERGHEAREATVHMVDTLVGTLHPRIPHPPVPANASCSFLQLVLEASRILEETGALPGTLRERLTIFLQAHRASWRLPPEGGTITVAKQEVKTLFLGASGISVQRQTDLDAVSGTGFEKALTHAAEELGIGLQKVGQNYVLTFPKD